MNVTCALCQRAGATIDLCTFQWPDEFRVHLLEEHGMELEIECWPDGGPVVVDETLTPADFAAGGLGGDSAAGVGS